MQIYQYFERVSKEEHVEKKGEELREWVREKLNIILDEELNLNLPREKKEFLVKELLDEILGLGPLEQYLEDPSVTEIMVNGHDKIYIERAGKLTETGKKIVSQQQLMTIIERIVSPLGRRIDESSPMVDARLADGSRVNAIIPPLAIDGATLTIRKFSKKKLGVEELARMNSITPEISAFLEICVKLRKNIIISGGTGSGKTTLLNILSCFIPSDERIVTVEDSAELQLLQPHVVRLESRPPNVEGKGAVPIRQLVINTLRMRPDRIVVGECRGGEALDMLQAMNTGHDGSLTTVHANTPKEAMARLETLVMMAGMDLPSRAIREQIAGAIDIIVQTNRFSDGSRKIEAVSEVTGIDESFQIVPQDIFVFEQTGIDPSGGRVLGRFHATGYKPSFLDEIRIHGLSLNTEMFEVRNHVA
ncbi:MAG TPA: CpaF family protein [bacterium]|nr:CpaF family protein [bacterium]